MGTPETPLVKLLSIEPLADIAGVPNGTDLDITAMGIPATVKIVTEDPTITEALVAWNLQTLADGTTYDKTLKTEQNFAITGIVMLPENVDANNVSLEVKILVTVQGENQCATPEFSLPDGEYTSNQTLEIVNIPSGVTVYYTLDGSDPTTSNTKYVSAIKLDGTEGQSVSYVVKAIAVQDGKEQSSIKKATYTITLSAQEEEEKEEEKEDEKEEEVVKPDTGTNKPVFDESDIIKNPSSNNSKPSTTKPTTSQSTTSTSNSSKVESSVTETPVLDESDIVSDPKDKEQSEFDVDAWMESEQIPTEINDSTEETDVEDSGNSDEPEKVEESKDDKNSRLPIYAAVAGTIAVAGGAAFFFLKHRKRKLSALRNKNFSQ